MKRPMPRNLIHPTQLLATTIFFLIMINGVAQEIPLFSWARQTVKGAGDDYGWAVTTDAAGNVLSTGEFTETADFDPGAALFNLSPFAPSSRDIFISKLDANGNFVWAKSIGGSSLDSGYGIVSDLAGNVYVTGYFLGTVDFDPGPSIFNLSNTNTDLFVLKLNAAGEFVWAKNFDQDYGNSIAYDPNGFVYVASSRSSTSKCSIIKLDLDGNTIWTRDLIGGTSGGNAISVDASGNVISSGWFNGTVDFDPGAGVTNIISSGVDMFIWKLDGSGNLVWAKNIDAGTTSLYKGGSSVDTSENIYLTGTFSGTMDFDPGAGSFDLTSIGGLNAFVCKLDLSGNFLWAKRIGGAGSGESNSISSDPLGNTYITGYFNNTVDFDPEAEVFNLTSAGNKDIFISKLDPAGNFLWATRTGSLSTDEGYAIHADASGNVYLSSYFYQTADFDPTCNTFNLTSGGASDVFIQKLSTGNSPSITSFSPTSGSSGIAVTITGTNFSTTPANNIVRFYNGISATVTASTATSITATAPNGIATGKISVTVGCVTVKSATDFALPICTNKLFDFTGANGDEPWGSLISDGTFLYGMTSQGGLSDLGTVFKIKSDGTGYLKLLDFAGTTNGIFPQGSLIFDGTFLYGMTLTGGLNDMGVIFKIKTDGTGFVKLLDFDGTTTGREPHSSLLYDGTFLYGMTSIGGTSNMGTIFKIKTDGTGFVKLLDFSGSANGAFPFGSLITDGTFLYGMSSSGGTGNIGTIFKIKTDGTGFAKLLDFSSIVSGRQPFGDLVSDGTFLYGMTYRGGTVGDGVIFKIKSDGTGYSKLLDFDDNVTGSGPFGSLIYDGTFLYGMTYDGISSASGTLFNIKPDGSEHTILCNFATYSEGFFPYGSLISDGAYLYGMTQQGGTGDKGAIFKYALPVTTPTITNFTPPSGPSGTTVTITGTNFSATSANNTVMFNGTTAVVTASTATSITCTVPSGATTGKITVTVSGNTATSASDFTVETVANEPPIIQPTTTAVPIDGIITIDLLPLISDPDDNLDLSTLSLVSSITDEGASAMLVGATQLELNYGNVAFAGTDRISISVCDLLSACTVQELSIEISGEIEIFNAVSPNNDNKNEIFRIANIDLLQPDNKVTIYNRWGSKVFEVDNYNNADRVFKGLNDNGGELPSGTYFYKIVFTDGESKSGYLTLKR
jgi:gliding motility-associated-like protein